MKRIYRQLLVAIGAVFLLSASTQAAPYMLPSDTPINIQFGNLEQIDLSGGNRLTLPDPTYFGGTMGNWGVLNITSIQSAAPKVSPPHDDIGTGPVIWSDDGAGGVNGQITGIFYDIQLTSPTTATGGTLDLYWHDAGSEVVDASDMAGNIAPTAATQNLFTSGTFLARLNFASGVIDGDTTTTLTSTINLDPSWDGNTLSVANSYANVDTSLVGAWTQVLNNDWFWIDSDNDGIRGEPGETRDLRFRNGFNGLSTWNDPGPDGILGTGDEDLFIKGALSTDPARVYTAVIPEPGTMILFGFGLLGLAGAARRKNS